MRLCLASLHYNPAAGSAPETYLQRFPYLRHLPQALARQGLEVHVVQHFPQAASLTEGPVVYHFVPGRATTRLAAVVRGRLARRPFFRGELALGAVRRIAELRPGVVHFQGLASTVNLLALESALGRPGPPIIAHYHGGLPARSSLARLLQRRALDRVALGLFTAHVQALPFLNARLLRPSQVEVLVEVSSDFERLDRAMARRETGMAGAPVFLSTGRLHPDKDPLTMLRGFERIAGRWPGARLYLNYLSVELLAACREYVTARPELAARVHFGGRADAADLELIYNSADFLLQASRREISGYAVVEAMACGVIPVVTDIPAFQAITRAGRYGILFPPGDAAAMARKVLEFDLSALSSLSATIRGHFDAALSYDAMAAKLIELYGTALGKSAAAG